MYNYTDTLISKSWEHVAKIEISTSQVYRSAFGVQTDVRSEILTPDRPANFQVKCINNDCTFEYFDLFDKVAGMAVHRIEKATGTLRCKGKEAKDHDNSCPCELDYEINIEYKKS